MDGSAMTDNDSCLCSRTDYSPGSEYGTKVVEHSVELLLQFS